MKLDLNDPVIQRIVQDDRPIALRKRRRSVASKVITDTDGLVQPSHYQQNPKTPSKAKKKVRFSDPGPDIIAATGLTPALRNASLGAPLANLERIEVRWPATPSRRRVTLPPINTTWDSSSPIEIHFAPIRQILTPRVKRQIARKDLSDEMNKIEGEMKLVDKQEAELKELREELVHLRRAKTPADRTYIEDSQLDLPEQDAESNLPDLDKDLSSIPDSHEDYDISSLDSEHPTFQSSHIFIDPDCQEVKDSQLESPSSFTLDDRSSKVHQAIQTETSLSELENHVAVQTAHLKKARLELERIFPGETTLPLTPPGNGDCSPLLNAMLGHLQAAHSSLRATKQSLSNLETQKNNLQSNFNQSLAKLDVARESYTELLKGARAGAEKYAQARQRITSLELEVEEGNKSSEKLRTALDTYRAEVRNLEDLIIKLEEEGKVRLETLRGEMDEAVADLECAVSAETRGRREAENELDTRALQIRVLEGSQQELKEAISEKQKIVRSLEEELDQVKLNKEQEVGFLNVRIGILEEELAGARSDIKRLEKEKAELVKLSNTTQTTPSKTIAQLRDELRKAVSGVEGIVGGLDKEVPEGNGSFRVAGLMTPSVEGGRFRDVAMDNIDGAVAVTRGKSRRSRKIDSAIGLLEEDIMDE